MHMSLYYNIKKTQKNTKKKKFKFDILQNDKRKDIKKIISNDVICDTLSIK